MAYNFNRSIGVQVNVFSDFNGGFIFKNARISGFVLSLTFMKPVFVLCLCRY